jgi:hypothetical protein
MAKKRERVLDKFKRGIAAAGPDYTAGVQDPKADWLSSYTSAQGRMASELQRALAEGRPQKGAERAGTKKWQDRAANVGAQRFTSAAQVAADEYGKVVNEVLSAGDEARQAASTLPDTSIDERIQRAAAAMRAISNHWKKVRG